MYSPVLKQSTQMKIFEAEHHKQMGHMVYLR